MPNEVKTDMLISLMSGKNEEMRSGQEKNVQNFLEVFKINFLVET